jgi:hypothetical protein
MGNSLQASAHGQQQQQQQRQRQQQQDPICFLDHAWGGTAPRVQLKALERLLGLTQLGNPTWDLVFGEIMPQVGEP